MYWCCTQSSQWYLVHFVLSHCDGGVTSWTSSQFCGKKLYLYLDRAQGEHRENRHTIHTERRELKVMPMTFSLWGDSANHCTAVRPCFVALLHIHFLPLLLVHSGLQGVGFCSSCLFCKDRATALIADSHGKKTTTYAPCDDVELPISLLKVSLICEIDSRLPWTEPAC